jgi:8-oxo-dGTP diphosphatase
MTVELERRDVVTAFLRHQGRLLLVRRSGEVGTYRGRWSAISGYLEQGPLAQALTEIREETGLDSEQVHLIAQGAPMEITDPELGVRWTVHPFLFDIDDPDRVRLDWENLEMRWVAPAELAHYQTVPGLAEAYRRCVQGW